MSETKPTADDCVKCGKPTPTVTQFTGTPEDGFSMQPSCGLCSTPRPRKVGGELQADAKVYPLPTAQRSAHDLVEDARARLKVVDAELARFDALRSERALLERILSCVDAQEVPT